jgi:hypothetical protein
LRPARLHPRPGLSLRPARAHPRALIAPARAGGGNVRD